MNLKKTLSSSIGNTCIKVNVMLITGDRTATLESMVLLPQKSCITGCKSARPPIYPTSLSQIHPKRNHVQPGKRVVSCLLCQKDILVGTTGSCYLSLQFYRPD